MVAQAVTAGALAQHPQQPPQQQLEQQPQQAQQEQQEGKGEGQLPEEEQAQEQEEPGDVLQQQHQQPMQRLLLQPPALPEQQPGGDEEGEDGNVPQSEAGQGQRQQAEEGGEQQQGEPLPADDGMAADSAVQQDGGEGPAGGRLGCPLPVWGSVKTGLDRQKKGLKLEQRVQRLAAAFLQALLVCWLPRAATCAGPPALLVLVA